MLAPSTPAIDAAPKTGFARLGSYVHRGETWLLLAAFAALTVLPVLAIATRAFGLPGINSTGPIVQHLVLIIGMLGGALAAREGRLLSLALASQVLKGFIKDAAHIFSSAVSVVVSGFLCAASVGFVRDQHGLGKIMAYGIPVWAVQTVLVGGFGVITWRLFCLSAANPRGRAACAALVALLVATILLFHIDPASLRIPFLLVLGLAVACGSPIFTALGGLALVLLWTVGEPVSTIALKHYSLSVNPTLPTLPLFTLAGYILAEGGAAGRLVRLFQAMVGGIRGGPALITALVCAFFTSFTGGSGVTIIALGGVLMPMLVATRYPERQSLGLITGAGSLGMLFPPCFPPILYAIIASTTGLTSITINEIFLGGLIPGLLLVVMTAWWGMRQAPADAVRAQPFSWGEIGAAAWAAKWELMAPVVAIVALIGGYALPVEAAALTAFYTFCVSFFVWREMPKVGDIVRVSTECGLLVGGIILILGVALGFTFYVVDAQIPDHLVAWATVTLKSKWLFLLALNIVLILVGGLIEIYAAIIVVVPLLIPLGIAFGIDPIHLGIIFLANMELGFLAPPIGLNLLLSSYRFKRPILEVSRATFPVLVVMFIGVLLITYFPPLTTFLPSLFR